MIDYKELLLKYMKVVYEEEGTTFIHTIYSGFSEQEMETLYSISGKLQGEGNGVH